MIHILYSDNRTIKIISAETKRNLQGDQILNTSSEPDTPAARSNNNYQPDDKIMQKGIYLSYILQHRQTKIIFGLALDSGGRD